MKTSFKYIAPAVLAIVAASCRDTSPFDEQPPMPDTEQTTPDTPGTDEPATSARNEQYRPQIHFTPAKNWMNDPNGMVWLDGTYHLFYQYNPMGNDWGNLSWGHATSTDLMHWEEQPVALVPDELGMVFSGSAVIDKNNTAGFGADALVALYTSADRFQQQSIAYSTDGGRAFTRYEGNPVIPNDNTDLRDPKVFWHEPSQQWIMCLALGWNCGIEFQGSRDLKNWQPLSRFTIPGADRCNKGQWECPDLICLDYNGREKWVLLVSTNPGGPAGGSGTMYFVGDFDGTTFTADQLDYPLWLDYGADNYAGVTWSNAPDGRHILIGWMNNWNYCGAVPCSPWRSANTLPRELSLIEYDGKPLLANTVVREVNAIAGEWGTFLPGSVTGAEAYELSLTVPLDTRTTFALANRAGEKLEMTVEPSSRKLLVKRNAATGRTDFASSFSIPAIQAPLNTAGNEVEFHIFVDASSVEVFTADGSMSQTNILFPTEPYNTLTLSEGTISASALRPLSSVWR